MATSLQLDFSDLYEEVEKYLGTYAAGSASAGDVTDAKFIVNRAYLRLLNAHDWTFLRRYASLITEDGKDVYDLPSDFGYMIEDRFTFSDDDSYIWTESRPLNWLRNRRSSLSWSNYPQYHAVHPGSYTKEAGQRWQVMFYPTPDSAYTLRYVYRAYPEKLVNDTDLPAGGPEASDVLLEACLAYAEAYKDETQAVHESKVQQIIAPLVDIDARRRPKVLGSLGPRVYQYGRGVVIEGGSLTVLS